MPNKSFEKMSIDEFMDCTEDKLAKRVLQTEDTGHGLYPMVRRVMRHLGAVNVAMLLFVEGPTITLLKLTTAHQVLVEGHTLVIKLDKVMKEKCPTCPKSSTCEIQKSHVPLEKANECERMDKEIKKISGPVTPAPNPLGIVWNPQGAGDN
jgi:hypothetical protein